MKDLHAALVWTEIGLAVVTFLVLLRLAAPYGRHARPGWGPTVPGRAAWVIMELPALVVFAVVFVQGPHASQTVPLLFLGFWMVHYIQRALVFPLRSRSRRSIPLLVPAAAFAFNCLNATINAQWISHFGSYTGWLGDPRFWVGAALMMSGMAINLHSDQILIRLRRPGESGYSIPRGGLFRYVSAPNYLGEIIEWVGWAIATWSLAGAAFALYTAANLVPRALRNHRWYQEKFPNYPPRKALVPGLL